MTKGRLLWVALVLLAGPIAACGGDDDASTPAADGGTGSSPDEVGGDDSDDEGSITDFGPSEPVIDPAAMPEQGDTRLLVEGETFDFAAADSAGSAYSCAVSEGSITVEYQLSPGLLSVQATHDGDRWQGQLTIAPPGTDRIYSSEVGLGGTFAVEGTLAAYKGDFTWRTNENPAALEDAGPGTLLISC